MLETWIDLLGTLPRIQLRLTKVQGNRQFPHWSARIFLHFVASKAKGKAIITHQKKNKRFTPFLQIKRIKLVCLVGFHEPWVQELPTVLVGMCFFSPSIFLFQAAIPMVSYVCKAEICLKKRVVIGHHSSLWFLREWCANYLDLTHLVVFMFNCNKSLLFFDYGIGKQKKVGKSDIFPKNQRARMRGDPNCLPGTFPKKAS